MKQKYLKPTCISATIPFPFIMGTVSTGTSNLPASGAPGTTTGGIGRTGAPKKV